jgi:arsenite methyltransferase
MPRAGLDKQPHEVAAMFDGVARRYDVTNDVLSLGQDRRWRRVAVSAVGAQPGEFVLDLAAGTGTSTVPFARIGARAVACDFSIGMLQVGKRAHPDLPFVAGDALALPFADETFDAAVATQVYEYVADMPAALAEARRVLRPGGRLLILDTDWDSIVWHSTDRDRMERVLEKWNDHLADPYLPRRLPGLLRDAGFDLREVATIPILNRGTDPNTYSRGLIRVVADFVGDDAWAADLESLGDDYFFSLNRYLFAAYKS